MLYLKEDAVKTLHEEGPQNHVSIHHVINWPRVVVRPSRQLQANRTSRRHRRQQPPRFPTSSSPLTTHPSARGSDPPIMSRGAEQTDEASVRENEEPEKKHKSRRPASAWANP